MSLHATTGLTIGDDAVRCTFCRESERLSVAVETAIGRVMIRCWACGETSYRVMPICDEAGRAIAPAQREPAPRPEGPWDQNRGRS